MNEEQMIKFRRSAATYDTRELAIEALNAQTFFYGVPIVAKYKVGEELHTILAIGVTDSASGATGASAYKIVSDSKMTELADDPDTYESEITDLSTPNSVGGIDAGTPVTDLKGQTFTELFDELLFPTIIPTVGNAGGLSLGRTPETLLFETGSTPEITFTANFNRGSYMLNGEVVADKFYLGDASGYEFFKGSTSVQSSASNTYTANEAISNGVTTYKVVATYGDGDVPVDNKGGQHTDVQGKAGSKEATVSIEGVYPWFATSETAGTFTKQELSKFEAGDEVTVKLVAGNVAKPQSMKIPADKTPTSIKLFNNLSGSFNIDEPMDEYTITDITESINGSNVSYKLYTYNGGTAGPVRGEVNLQITF